MKDQIFTEVQDLVQDLINKGKVKESDIKGNRIEGTLEGHKILFEWEKQVTLLMEGKMQPRIVYHVYIDDLTYVYNCELNEHQKEELQALYGLKEKISEMSMMVKDKSEIVKFMAERRKGKK